jgi:hypothetical protein
MAASLNLDQNTIKRSLALWGIVEKSLSRAYVGVQKSDNIKNEMSRSHSALCLTVTACHHCHHKGYRSKVNAKPPNR